MYQLPHPLSLLDCPPSKTSAKNLFKTHVVDHWQTKFRNESSKLSSLEYFKPNFMSLLVPHPLWSTCGSNPYEICKAIVQAKMLSGRYRTDRLLRHFSNSEGFCSICNENEFGSLEHLLVSCSTLNQTRNQLLQSLARSNDFSKSVKSLVLGIYESKKNLVQLLLDGSAQGPTKITRKMDQMTTYIN